MAFGSLASLFLTDKPAALIDEIYSFCGRVGLPTTPAQIGLCSIIRRQLTCSSAANMPKPDDHWSSSPSGFEYVLFDRTDPTKNVVSAGLCMQT